MLSLEHETFFFTNGALIPKIYLASSFANAMFSSGNSRETLFASCLAHTCRALPRENLHISIFRACTTRPKVALVRSGTKASGALGGKSERSCLFVVVS